MKLTSAQTANFQQVVWEYFRMHARSMPWRDDPNPYYVLVSELMLQQTQVSRVVTKFTEFIERFPDVKSLADAPLAAVLIAWNGLGYNRRAKFLHETARKIATEHDGKIPDALEALVTLPGIGPNTAGAVLAYAYNQPTVFVETNVRTVLFHHFFADYDKKISDKELRELAEQVLDRDSSREWYWALMDYGTHLKKTAGGRLESSRHYKKQSPLQGSLREVRGRIIKVLTEDPLTETELQKAVGVDERFTPALAGLKNERLVTQKGGVISLTGHVDAR